MTAHCHIESNSLIIYMQIKQYHADMRKTTSNKFKESLINKVVCSSNFMFIFSAVPQKIR